MRSDGSCSFTAALTNVGERSLFDALRRLAAARQRPSLPVEAVPGSDEDLRLCEAMRSRIPIEVAGEFGWLVDSVRTEGDTLNGVRRRVYTITPPMLDEGLS